MGVDIPDTCVRQQVAGVSAGGAIGRRNTEAAVAFLELVSRPEDSGVESRLKLAGNPLDVSEHVFAGQGSFEADVRVASDRW